MILEIPTDTLIIAVVTIAIILIIIWYYFVFNDDQLTGFWRVDPEFEQKNGIDEFLLCISPPKRGMFHSKRHGYVTISSGEEVHEQIIDIDYPTPWFRVSTIGPSHIKFRNEVLFNKYMKQMKVHKNNGTLTLRSDDGLLVFFKDPYLTYQMNAH